MILTLLIKLYILIINFKQFSNNFAIQRARKKKKLAKHRRDTHNVVHVGMEDTEKVLLYSLVGIATNIKGYIERRENYAGFMACNWQPLYWVPLYIYNTLGFVRALFVFGLPRIFGSNFHGFSKLTHGLGPQGEELV